MSLKQTIEYFTNDSGYKLCKCVFESVAVVQVADLMGCFHFIVMYWCYMVYKDVAEFPLGNLKASLFQCITAS